MTSPADRELGDVDWLLLHGLGGSARGWIGSARGSAANRRLEACRTACPHAAVHVLLTARDGSRAWSAPATLDLGLPRHADEHAKAALEAATTLVERGLSHEVHRHIRLTAEDRWMIDGYSLGLPAALAFAAWLCDRRPRMPVFASGRILDAGVISSVDHLSVKIRAALADLADHDGLVLVPEIPEGITDPRVVAVSSWSDVVVRVFGAEPLSVAPRNTTLGNWLRDMVGVHSDEALRRLDGVDAGTLKPRDRVLYLVHRGNHLRHVGRTREAHAAHEHAADVARQARLDTSVAEELALEQRNTLLDFFELEEPIAWLRERAGRPFASVRNELYLRGTLSRALAMQGRLRDALVERLAVMPLHDEDQDLARELPRSLTELVLIAGLARDEGACQDAVAQLVRTRTRADPWTTYAAVRAHVLLGHDSLVCAWVDGRDLALAQPYRDAIGSLLGEARGRHPFTSTLRAVVRALRRSHRFEEAIDLARSVAPRREGLEAWVAWTCLVEAALTLRAAGRTDEGDALLEETREHLRASSPHATRRYHRLLDGTWEDIDVELETVFY